MNMPVNAETAAATPQAQPRTHRWGAIIRGLLIVVLIVAIVLVAWQAQQWHQQTYIKQHQLTTLLRQQQQHTALLEKKVTELLQQQQQQQTQSAQTQQQIVQLQQQASGKQTWKVAEIAYLVRLADLQLRVQQAVPLALALLQQAAAETQTVADPQLAAFQQSLAGNIRDLQAINTPDRVTIAGQLSTLQEQVPNLSLLVAPHPGTSPVTDSAHQQHKKWWQRAWDNIKASFNALVIVRHEQQSLPALMPPEQQTYLQQNLQLLLVQARWALINQQSALYASSLRQTRAWVEKFYVQNSATTQSFLKQLALLQATAIAPPLPDLTHTLSLLPQE